MSNPWLPPQPVVEPDTEADQATRTARTPTGAAAPQRTSVTAPEAADQLAWFTPSTRPAVWVLGTHGGSAETTIATLLGAGATGHRWPQAGASGPDSDSIPRVLLAARTHPAGLRRAQLAMRAWAAGSTPPVRMLGLVLVADAPGKLPRQIRDQIAVLGGGVPHLWQLPWDEDHRLGLLEQTTRPVRRLVEDITALLDESPSPGP